MIPRVIIPFSPLSSRRSYEERSRRIQRPPTSNLNRAKTKAGNYEDHPPQPTSCCQTLDLKDHTRQDGDQTTTTSIQLMMDDPLHRIKLDLPPSSPPPIQASCGRLIQTSPPTSPSKAPSSRLSSPGTLSLESRPTSPLDSDDILPKTTVQVILPSYRSNYVDSRDIRAFFPSTTAPSVQDLHCISSSPNDPIKSSLTSSRLTSCPPPPPLSSRKVIKNKKVTRPMSQLLLDISNRPTTQICPDCGMSYVIGVQEDLELHKKHHRRVVEGLEWDFDDQYQPEFRVVWRAHHTIDRFDGDGDGDASGYLSSPTMEEEKIIKLSLDPQNLKRSKLKNKVQQILEMVNFSLDAQELTKDQLKVSSLYLYVGPSKASNSSSLRPHYQSKKQRLNSHDSSLITKTRKKKLVIKAMCVAARIQHAYQIVRGPDSSDQVQSSSLEGLLRFGDTTSELYCSPKVEETLIGIHRIWTSPIHRTKGIGRRLLDSIAMTFIYGMPVESDESRRRLIAFSQPTESGMRLASKWFKTFHFKIFID